MSININCLRSYPIGDSTSEPSNLKTVVFGESMYEQRTNAFLHQTLQLDSCFTATCINFFRQCFAWWWLRTPCHDRWSYSRARIASKYHCSSLQLSSSLKHRYNNDHLVEISAPRNINARKANFSARAVEKRTRREAYLPSEVQDPE